MRAPRPALGLAVLLSLAAGGAGADPLPLVSGGYGFAGNVLDGTYIGAPLTRVPSSSRLVPPAWGYGTYGVPTVAGIREAPAGRPALYVVEGSRPAADRLAPPRRGARVLSREADGRWSDVGNGGTAARVVQVRVPVR